MRALLALLALAWLVVAVPAWAQPASVTVSPPVTDATGATFTITWSGGAPVAWSGAYNDGSAPQQGTSTSPLTLRMPYHASGAAATGWICVTGTCAGVPVPAKPVGPVVSSTRTASYREPTTLVDGRPLTDLVSVKLYYVLNGGAEQSVTFPASRPTGGGLMTQTFTVPATQGTLVVTATAVTTAEGESLRHAPVTLVFAPAGVTPDKGTIITNKITQ